MTRVAVAGVLLVPGALASAASSPLYLGPGDASGAAGVHYIYTDSQFTHLGVSNAGVAAASLDQVSGTTKIDQTVLIWSPTLAPTPLGVPAGNSVTVNTPAINARGVVIVDQANSSPMPATERAYRFAALSTSGTSLDQSSGSTPAGTYNRSVVNVSDSGSALGASSTRANGADTGNRAAVWAPGSSTPIALQQLSIGDGNVAISTARFMNDAGVIAGTATKYFQFAPGFPTVAKGTRPVRWASTSTAPVELLPINANSSGYSEGEVLDLSSSGMAVGQTHKYQGDVDLGARPVRWAAGDTAVTELAIPGSPKGTFDGQVNSINPTNVSVGYAKDLALRWDASGTPTVLQPLHLSDGVNTARPVSINALGASCGISSTTFITAAAIWLPGATSAAAVEGFATLPARTHLVGANAISDTGFVTGVATYDPLNTGTLSIKYYTLLIPQAGTYGKGDANFDTVVNFDDLVILAQHYNDQNPLQAINVGDFNLDGVVNFDDLVLLAQNYNKSPGNGFLVGEATFAADWTLAQSLVPEPGVIGVSIGLGMITKRRVRAAR